MSAAISLSDAAKEMRVAMQALNDAGDDEARCRAALADAEKKNLEASRRAQNARDLLVAASLAVTA